MARIPAVGINDDFTAGQSRISGRTAYHKATGWIDIDFSLRIEIFFRNNRVDDGADNVFPNAGKGNVWVML